MSKKNNLKIVTAQALKAQIEKRETVKIIYNMMKDYAAVMIQNKDKLNPELYEVFKQIDEYKVNNIDQLTAVEMCQIQALYMKSYAVMDKLTKEQEEENNDAE